VTASFFARVMSQLFFWRKPVVREETAIVVMPCPHCDAAPGKAHRKSCQFFGTVVGGVSETDL
jgi:hypothetical protein